MYDDRRTKLAKTLEAITDFYQEIITDFPEFATASLAQTLEKERAYFATAQPHYKIAVVGSCGSGKTTLLKALFFDRGLAGLELPTSTSTTTQVPTIVHLIPGYNGPISVKSRPIAKKDLARALYRTLEEIEAKISLPLPDFETMDLQYFTAWVNRTAIPAIKPHQLPSYIEDLQETIQIFRVLDPSYRFPAINDIPTALAAVKDPKASRAFHYIRITLPAQHLDYPVQFIDFPGLELPNVLHRQFLYHFITTAADAILLVKDAQRSRFSDKELQLLDFVATCQPQMQQKCFFIFNKWHDTEHPGAERIIRQVIHNYQFPTKNIFRTSALPAFIYIEENHGIDIESKYLRALQEWAINNFRDLSQKYGDQLLSEMAVIQLQEFLEYYYENSLPMQELTLHTADIDAVLTTIGQRLGDIGDSSPDFDSSSLTNDEYEEILSEFKENVSQIEASLDEFADSLQESISKLMAPQTGGDVPAFEPSAPASAESPGKFGTLLERVKLLRRDKTNLDKNDSAKSPQQLDVPISYAEADVFSEEPDWLGDDDADLELLPQRPGTIMSCLLKEIFPGIDIYHQVRVIVNYTAGRSCVHSHEVELAVIRDINQSLREKILALLAGIVKHYVEVVARTIDNEGYLDHIDQLLARFELSQDMQPRKLVMDFLDELKTRLEEACAVLAEIIIKKVDAVGGYDDEFNRVAAIPYDSIENCRRKQKALLHYLEKKYANYLALAFQDLEKQGWPDIGDQMAKSRERLVGLLSRHDIINAKIFEERQARKRRGDVYDPALFEEMEQLLRQKIAGHKEALRHQLHDRLEQRNSQLGRHRDKLATLTVKWRQLSSNR